MVADSHAGRRRARRRFGSTGASGAHDRSAATTGAPLGRADDARAGGLGRNRWLRRGLFAAAALGVSAAVVVPLAAQAGGVDAVASIRDVLVGAAVPGAVRDADPASSADGSTPAAAFAAPDTGAEGVEISIAPTTSTSFTPGAAGSTVAVSVELENLSGSFLDAGTLELVRAGSAIDDGDELDAWLASAAATTGFGSGAVSLATSPTRALATGGVTQVVFDVPAQAFDALAGSPVIGLGAQFSVGDLTVSTQTSALANTASPGSGAAPIALVAPLTVPAETSGLIGADELAEWTAPAGLLTRQLDALAGRDIAIGIDPRIIVSIRSLGTAAPPEALEWLQRLADVPNETFPLAYADADLAVQSQIGLPAPLAPVSFADVLDPDDFATDPATGDTGMIGADPLEATDEAEDGGEAGGDDGSAAQDPADSPTPVPTEPVSPVPDTEQLLDWPYTRADIAWPGDRTVAPGDISFFNAAGLTTTILDAANVEPLIGADASALVDGGTAIVSDDDLTAAVRTAASATSDIEWRDATGEVLARAALDGATGSGSPLLATFGRDADAVPERVGDLVAELTDSPFVAPTGLAQAIGAPPTARTLVDSVEGDARLALVRSMVAAETEVDAFATVLADVDDLVAPTRREMLALLDVGWLAAPTEWAGSAAEWTAAQRELVDSVSVVPSSTVLVVASSTGIPVTVQNTSEYPVIVEVDVAPSNGRLVVDEPVQVTVEPASRNTVSVPVAAGVGNGEVLLTVSLRSLSGVPVGSTAVIQADVQADWEGLGAAILGGILIVVFGIGIWRNIRRRRRQRAADAAAAAEPTTETDAPIEPDTDQGPESGRRLDG
ncbi:hypothetical protein BJ978_001037 [Agromyces terreus]|uniref:2-oxoglutarate dehydrogenase n=1 Tax=Agromyces terreus TaxID=424795 RepID=A0A9X2KBH2_9MICO|nr:DUF6049 family protein [Agromyces terreus]MCP2370361.1 hypothetical protein [Agromyces terreus]